MREILFRGKTCYNGDWVFGELMHSPVLMRGKRIIKRDVTFIKKYECCAFDDVDPETIGQYTGLEDCNGVKIFEGDIVRVSSFSDNHKYLLESNEIDGTLPYEIIYSAGSFQCVNSKAYMPFDAGEWFTQLEVVGNIYDNPELLSSTNEEAKEE